MPVQWRTKRIGSVVITHDTRHEPKALLSAIGTPPVEIMGDKPAVSKHAYGRQFLSIRTMNSEDYVHGQKNDTRFPLEKMFTSYQDMVRRRNARVELPVALIEDDSGQRQVVTWWKKDTRSLFEALNDAERTDADRTGLLHKCIMELARLHAGGDAHGHPHLRNFLLDKGENVKLVDICRIQALPRFFNQHARQKEVGYFLRQVRKSKLVPWNNQVKTELRQSYENAYRDERNKRWRRPFRLLKAGVLSLWGKIMKPAEGT